ncbi:hypothetical protein C3F34_15335 [Acinetobacter sp. ACNIH2]|uniref:hypothetical protein n=1 Tax=Acinetobacter sp. ACNIH2 TaxID=1758189 RepID=UPI000CDCC8EE|nr:hypothetical protein [Acinetobacter sp. ACNIH2]AUX87280.1 hypothetical protein C3F34_15335 [Acinetobacter sp. ACNIH2]
MKIQHLIYGIILSSFASIAIAAPTLQYMECLAADQQHHFVLVAPAQNGQTIKLMYFPYLKPISLHYIKTENIEMAEDRPYEQHLFFNERNFQRNTGQYEIILQGARIYAVIYSAKQSGAITTYQNYLADKQKQKVNQKLIAHKLQCI